MKADQEKSANLRIVSACDKSYFPGLCMTLASAVVHLPKSIRPCVTVIHAGLLDFHKKQLEELLRKSNRSTEVHLHEVSVSVENLPIAPGLHPLAYARLLAPDIVEEENFIYLDSDLLVMRDISELLQSLDQGSVAAAPVCGILGDDCPWLDPLRMRADDQYFCSGVMVINKFLWKEKGLTESSIALAMKEPEKCKNYDQTVLNFLLHGMVNIVDESWGWNHWRFAEMPEGPVILHYITGGKPWRVPLEYGSRGLWLKAYERLCGDVFPWNRRQMILKAKVNALEKSLHGATTFGFPGRVVEMLSRKKFQEWKWSGEKARQEKTGMCLGNLERALERLDSQIENNRERQEFANF